MDELRAEVVVVGAGVMGASVALRLARSGRQVLLLGAEDAPGTASMAAGAMLGTLGETTSASPDDCEGFELDLRLRAHEMWPGWWESVSAAAPQAPPLEAGTFVAAGRSSDVEAVRAIELVARRTGLPAQRVAPEDVPGLEPAPGRRTEAALYLPQERWIDAPRLLRSLLKAARETGRVLRDPERATKLLTRGGSVCGVELDAGRSVSCETVVVCSGRGTSELLDDSGLAGLLPRVIGAKGVAVELRPLRALGEASGFRSPVRTPNREFACGLHVVPRGGGVYLGATNRVTRWPGLTGAATAGEVAQLLHDAGSELSCRLQRWDLTALLWGERPLCSDGLPVVGALDGVEGLFVATGGYRNGVLLSPLLADLVGEEIAGTGGEEALRPGGPRMAPPTAAEVLTRGLEEYHEMVAGKLQPPVLPRPGDLQQTLGRLALDRSPDGQAVRRQLAAVLTEFPLREMVPEALIEACYPHLLEE